MDCYFNIGDIVTVQGYSIYWDGVKGTVKDVPNKLSVKMIITYSSRDFDLGTEVLFNNRYLIKEVAAIIKENYSID